MCIVCVMAAPDIPLEKIRAVGIFCVTPGVACDFGVEPSCVLPVCVIAQSGTPRLEPYLVSVGTAFATPRTVIVSSQTRLVLKKRIRNRVVHIDVPLPTSRLGMIDFPDAKRIRSGAARTACAYLVERRNQIGKIRW